MSSHLFEYALNTLWQLPLLAAATWLLIRLTRPTTLLQHLLWIATLATAAILPLRQPTASPLLDHGPTTALSLSRAPQPVLLTSTLILHVAQLWLLALAFNLLRITYAWITARRLIAASEPLDSDILDPALLEMCAERLQIDIPEIRLTQSTTPAVAGIFHPVLLLPTHLVHNFELTTVLLHEFAHIRRRDPFVNLACRLLALPIAWHPVTPLLQTRITQTRELLTDSLAAQALGSSTTYARSLLTLARDLSQLTAQPLALGLFPANRSQSALEERIMHLIAPAQPVQRAVRLATGVAVVLTATAIAGAFHLQPAHAQTNPTPATPPSSLLQAAVHAPSNLRSMPVAAIRVPQEPYLADRNVDAARTLPIMTQTPEQTSPALPLTPPVPPAPGTQVAPPAPLPSPRIPEPASAPIPAPASQTTNIFDGVQRGLTPEEQNRLNERLDRINDQVRAALSSHLFSEQQLTDQLKNLNIPDLNAQMDELRKQLDSPAFRNRIEEAQKRAQQHIQQNLQEHLQQRLQERAADHAIDSEALRQEIAQVAGQMNIVSAQIANEHIHIDSAELQRQLDRARKQLEEAQKKLNQVTP